VETVFSVCPIEGMNIKTMTTHGNLKREVSQKKEEGVTTTGIGMRAIIVVLAHLLFTINGIMSLSP